MDATTFHLTLHSCKFKFYFHLEMVYANGSPKPNQQHTKEFLLQLYSVIAGNSNTLNMVSLENFGDMLPRSYWKLILIRCGLLGQIHSWPKITPFSIFEPGTKDPWIEFLFSLIQNGSHQTKLDIFTPECISTLPVFSQ